MKAHLETRFDKGFLLSEENLIKLSDIVAKRLSEATIAERLQFKIFRVDGALLETDSHASVTDEENSSRNAIKRLELSVTSNNFSFRLVFDPKEKVDLSIEAENKDFAYLLFSDVKEYLSSEVLTFRSFSFDDVLSGKTILPLMAMMIPLLTFVMLRDTPKVSEVEALMASGEVNEKLNFLIQNTVKQQELGNSKYLFVVMIAIALLPILLGSMLDKAFPRNIFCWGKMAASYERFLKRREKIIWGIVVAFVIGVASTVAVDYFKAAPQQSGLSRKSS